jgi:hypothetical protein
MDRKEKKARENVPSSEPRVLLKYSAKVFQERRPAIRELQS